MEIEALRIKLGLSRSKAAVMGGVDRNTLTCWESKSRPARIDKLVPYIKMLRNLALEKNVITDGLKLPHVYGATDKATLSALKE